MPQIVHSKDGAASTTSHIRVIKDGVATALLSVWQVFDGAVRLVWPPAEVEVDETALSIYEKSMFWADTAEASGSVADEEVTGADGTYVGVVSYNARGRNGQGKYFSTASDVYAIFPQVAGTQVDRDFTVCNWFYATDTSTNQTIFGTADGAGDASYRAVKGGGGSTGKVVMLINAGFRELISSAYSLNTWHFLVYDKAAGATGEERLLIDNVVEDTEPSQSLGYEAGSYLLLGGSSAARGFGKGDTGAVAQLMFFSPKLTDDELTWLYNGGAGRTWAAVLEAAGIT